MAEKNYHLKISVKALEDHVKRICRSNLKRPCKICMECPFINPILNIMDSYNWGYNKEVRKNPFYNKNDNSNKF